MRDKKIIYSIITIILVILQSIIIFKVLVMKSEQTDIMNSQKIQLQLDQLIKYELQEIKDFHIVYFRNNFNINEVDNIKTYLQNKPINITNDVYLFIQDENYNSLNYFPHEYDIDFKYLKNNMKANTTFEFTDFVIINDEVYYQSLFPIYDSNFNIKGYQLIQNKIDENFLEKLKTVMGLNVIQIRFPTDIFLLDENISENYFQVIKKYLYEDSQGQFEIFILDEKIVSIYKSYVNYKNKEDFISIYIETFRNTLSMSMIWLILLITWQLDLVLSIILFITNNVKSIFYQQEKDFSDISEDIQNIHKERIANISNKLDYENSEEYNRLNNKLIKIKMISEERFTGEFNSKNEILVDIKDGKNE